MILDLFTLATINRNDVLESLSAVKAIERLDEPGMPHESVMPQAMAPSSPAHESPHAKRT
jgi:hypothetical protein